MQACCILLFSFALFGGTIVHEPVRLDRLRSDFLASPWERREVSLECVVNARVGDYLIVHDGSGGICVRAPCRDFPFGAGDAVALACVVPSGENPATFCAEAVTGELRSNGPSPTPVEADVASVLSGKFDYRLVRVRGVITEAFRDEIDPAWVDFVLESCNLSIVLTLCDDNATNQEILDRYIDRVVSAEGVCDPTQGMNRKNRGRIVGLSDLESIREFQPSAGKEGDLPRRVCRSGTVIANWHENAFFLKCDNGDRVRVYLTHGASPPAAGQRAVVAGFRRNDGFFSFLSNAVVLRSEPGTTGGETPEDLCPHDVLFDAAGHDCMRPTYDGRLIRLRARVKETSRSKGRGSSFVVDCDGLPVEVEAGEWRSPEEGASVLVTGACRFNTSSRHGGGLKLDGFSIVPRNAADVVVTAPPPWWTMRRLQIAVGSLLVLLVGFVAWNRVLNRTINRRCRELLRAQLERERADLKTGERTRLAVELHDSLSQNLSGVACQIAAACEAIPLGTDALRKRLETASRMLDSSRMELKRCLWDLRGDALEEPDFTKAILKALDPLSGGISLAVRFRVPRAKLSDTTAHSIICIVRELCSNAIRHGHASVVRIAGCVDGPSLMFSVEDNGEGFDPKSRVGPAEGHFGLEGVRERVSRLGGSMSVMSEPGRGARIKVVIPLFTGQEG